MKILLATDGSEFSQAAIEEVIRRRWPSGTKVKVLSVAHPFPLFPDPIFFSGAAHSETLQQEQRRASHDVEKAAGEIRDKAPDLHVEVETLEGSPKKVIVEEAERWEADLIVVGSHGRGAVERFLLGSVAHAVVLHAPCSVEIVRRSRAT